MLDKHGIKEIECQHPYSLPLCQFDGEANTNFDACDAFGNALGESLARANGQSANRTDDLDAFLALNDNFSGVDANGGAIMINGQTFSQNAAATRAAGNPAGLPTYVGNGGAPAGYGVEPSGNGILGWQDRVSAQSSTVRAGDYGGSMERIARAQLGSGASQRDINNYVGQLIEINGIKNPRAVGGDWDIALPGVGTLAATSGLGVYGKDIALGEQMKAATRAELTAASAQAATNANAGFADGRDARDMRLSFGYQSMMSRELSDLRPLPGSELRTSTLSPREATVDWVRSVVGTDRAGNVIAGAVNGWLAGGEAVLKIPEAIAAIPSVVTRLASGTASAATQLWNDPVGSVTNTMTSGVDGFRTGFNQTVNGNGFAMGSALFAMGTMGVPLGRAEGIAAATRNAAIDVAEDVPLGFTRAYRAVSSAEYDSALQSGRFSQGPNALEGKWFADSYENALLHGDALEGVGKYRILQADLPNSAPSLFKMSNLDGRGPARYLHLDDLVDVTPRPFNGGK